MARLETLKLDGDIGHFHCVDPIHHLHYLSFFDWNEHRTLKWQGKDSLRLQLICLNDKNPLDNMETWLCRCWDTLMLIMRMNSSTQEKRKWLREWNSTTENWQRTLLHKLFAKRTVQSVEGGCGLVDMTRSAHMTRPRTLNTRRRGQL